MAATIERAGLNRRGFLGLWAIGAPALALGLTDTPGATRPVFGNDPFQLGVASGEPLPDGVVLWTRLAPNPLAEDGSGGMPPDSFRVRYEVAEDSTFATVVRRGVVEATPELGHSVHLDVQGLRPAREYFYRFRVGSDISPTGRTKTAPAYGAHVPKLEFAFASCQNFPAGYFVGLRDMLAHDLDVVVHLGDYIYEGDDQGDPSRQRGHLPNKEITTLAEYRVRHGQYKTDPDLQAMHGTFPVLATLDDHDVDNNWAADLDGHDVATGFLERRAAAFQAFYENLPLRRSSIPHGPDALLYRRLSYADIADFHLLDTRQYRSNQPSCTEERIDGYCPEALDPSRTILGDEQEGWLYDGLRQSHARWNVIANQTRFAPVDIEAGEGKQYGRGGDPWGDGYVHDRQQLSNFIDEVGPTNPVIITGDAHRSWVFDLKEDFDDAASRTVATEYLATSISTSGDSLTTETRFGGTTDNPYEVFTDGHRGYVKCSLSQREWRSDFRVSDSVTTPDAPLYTIASFVTEDGRPGAQRV